MQEPALPTQGTERGEVSRFASMAFVAQPVARIWAVELRHEAADVYWNIEVVCTLWVKSPVG